MNDLWRAHVEAHVATAHGLSSQLPALAKVTRAVRETFAQGGVLYTFGNGGSAADAQHLTGELIGRYRRERRPLPAVTLTGDATVMTCIGNDYSFDAVFARQLEALARPGDVVCAFTTSGRSANIVAGLAAARERGATTVLFAGASDGPAVAHADHVLRSPSTETPRIQEAHTLLLHMLSDAIDAWAAGEQE